MPLWGFSIPKLINPFTYLKVLVNLTLASQTIETVKTVIQATAHPMSTAAGPR